LASAAMFAIACGLMGKEFSDLHKQAQAAEQLEQLGFSFLYQQDTEKQDSLLGNLLDKKYFRRAVVGWCSNATISDEKIEILKDLRGLKYLNLSGTKISDKCFRQLEKVPDLKRLYVYGTPLTHKGVRRLNHYLPKCTVYHDAGVLRAKIAC
jgi:Leucine-rich repeat (LRR) protein